MLCRDFILQLVIIERVVVMLSNLICIVTNRIKHDLFIK